MNILQLAACAVGHHRRDRRRAWHDDQVVRSYCAGCGKPMLRGVDGWHLTAPHPVPPPGESRD